MPKSTPPQAHIRGRMVNTADPRALRTRQKLVDAFRELALADETGSDEITVAKLVDRAGVNRTSFYAHFTSQEELAVEALAEFFEIVASSDAAGRGHGADRETSEESLREVVGFIGARRRLYSALLGTGANHFYAAVEDAFTERNRSTLRAMADLPAHVDIETTARFVASGVMGVVSWWLRSGATEAPDVVARRLRDLLPPWFTTS